MKWFAFLLLIIWISILGRLAYVNIQDLNQKKHFYISVIDKKTKTKTYLPYPLSDELHSPCLDNTKVCDLVWR